MKVKFTQFEKLEKKYEYLENPISARICDKLSDFGCWISRLSVDIQEKIMQKAIIKQDKLAEKIQAHPSYDKFYGAE